MTAEAEIPTQFTHSVKITDTAKGIRIDFHVYANDRSTAVREAFETYLLAKVAAEQEKIPLAPIEVNSK
jgi:hypothetical protein